MEAGLISSVEGVLAGKNESSVVVEVGGFGVEINVPGRMLAMMGNEGEKVRLLTWLLVREDALSLFGFPSGRDREMFLMLLGVSGVGPKLALGMLSALDSSEIARFVHGGDAAGLVAIPGIGRKTAERIILELKDKVDVSKFRTAPGGETFVPAKRELMEEALAALIPVGLTGANARRALDDIDPSRIPEQAKVEDLVREALRRASSR